MQNVNLYQPEHATGLQPPSLALLLRLLAIIVLLVLADAGWQLWQVRQLGSELQVRRQEAEQAEQALASAQQSFREPQADPALPALVAAAEREQRELQWMGQYVQSLDHQRAGFSPLLDGLAQQHVPGIWLRGFRFAEGGHQLTLQGSARQQQLLTDYLASLGRSPAFAGRQFAWLQLDRDAGGNLLFALSSQAASKEERK